LFKRPPLTRRATLTALASAPALGMLGARAGADDASAQTAALTPGCILSPQAAEGPYVVADDMRGAPPPGAGGGWRPSRCSPAVIVPGVARSQQMNG